MYWTGAASSSEITPRAVKFMSGRRKSMANATSRQASSRKGWATPALSARRASRGVAGGSGRPSRAASTPAMYSSTSISPCVCAAWPTMPTSQKSVSVAICIAGASEK
ncbi:hypothetical protein D9M69_516780 [compost metagenome]